MTIGCKTGGPGEGVSYRGSHGQTVRVGRSDNTASKAKKPSHDSHSVSVNYNEMFANYSDTYAYFRITNNSHSELASTHLSNLKTIFFNQFTYISHTSLTVAPDAIEPDKESELSGTSYCKRRGKCNNC